MNSAVFIGGMLLIGIMTGLGTAALLWLAYGGRDDHEEDNQRPG